MKKEEQKAHAGRNDPLPPGPDIALVRPLPREGEHYIGYFLRLAHSNGLLTASWFKNTGKFQGLFRSSRRVRWCPICFTSCDPYWKDVWMTGPGTCFVHKCWLTDVCSDCGKPTTWSRVRMFSCQCEHEFCRNRKSSLPAEVQRLISAAVRNREGSEWWRQFEVSRRWSIARIFGALSIYGLQGKPLKKASISSMDAERMMVATGAKILCGGEKFFHRFLDGLRQLPKDDQNVQLMPEAFPGLLSTLRKQLAPNEFSAIVPLVVSYLSSKADSKVAISWRTSDLSATSAASGAAALLKVRPEQVLDALVANGIRPKYRRTSSGKKMVAIGAKDLERARRFSSVSLASMEVHQLYGLSPARQAQLVKDELLCKTQFGIDRGSIVQLFSCVEERANLLRRRSIQDPIVWGDALRTLVPVPLTSEFWRRVKDGVIPVQWSRRDHDGTRIMEVSKSSTKAVIGDLQRKIDNYFSVHEAAAWLKLDEDSVNLLILSKQIRVTWRYVGSKRFRFIALAEMEKRVDGVRERRANV